MVEFMMTLNKVHLYNLGPISDMINEIFPDMFQLIDVLNRTVDMFNNYSASLQLKAICTLDDNETDVGYSGHSDEDF